MDHSIKQMKIFIEVARLKSFTKAAERLGMPKGAVSSGVSKLETSLQTRLLHRTTRSVQLTQDGSFFLEKCNSIILDLEEAEAMFKNDERKLKGKLKVDVPSRIARKVIIPNLEKFNRVYPFIEVELGSTDRKVDLIQEGIDCVIRVGSLSDSSLIVRKIGDLEIINCASPEYLKVNGKVSKVEDLKNHKLVGYFSSVGREHAPKFSFINRNEELDLKMDSIISVNNAESYIAAALSNLGIIQVPRYDVKDLIDNNLLVQVLPECKLKPMQISFLYPHRRHLSQRVKVFMDWSNSLLDELL